MTAETQLPQPKNKTQSRKFALLLATFFFVFAGVGYFAYWFTELRHYQTTEDAYVAGNQVQVMSQVSGSVTKIYVDNTDFIQQGDLLLTLDPTDAKNSYEHAKASLANNVRQIHQLIVSNKQLLANIELKRTLLKQVQDNLKRREKLGLTGSITKETLDHARDAVETAKIELDVAIQQYNANNALVLNTPLKQQPTIQLAITQLKDAWLALQRTNVVAPMTGYVSRRNVQVGAQIKNGTPLMVLVSPSQLWVDANFKETQLINMRIGQPVTIVSDFYGEDVVYNGKVTGLDMGTGSAFSLLPAQNATGNWIKVVQRLPVRIELNAEQMVKYPLRIGLSMTVSVNTKNLNGKVLAEKSRNTTAYETNALSYDPAAIDKLINDIIQTNAS